MLGEVGQKRDDVVAGLTLDLVDALDVEGAAFPDRPRRAFRDDTERRLRVARMRLDLEPDPVAVFRRPDPGHLGPAVARDHDSFVSGDSDFAISTSSQ
jgi:L-rhamnose isomerase